MKLVKSFVCISGRTVCSWCLKEVCANRINHMSRGKLLRRTIAWKQKDILRWEKKNIFISWKCQKFLYLCVVACGRLYSRCSVGVLVVVGKSARVGWSSNRVGVGSTLHMRSTAFYQMTIFNPQKKYTTHNEIFKKRGNYAYGLYF